MTDVMDALQIAMILQDLGGLSDTQWEQLKQSENARRALLSGQASPVTTPASPTYATVGQRIKFPAHTRPMRIAGRTAEVIQILSKGNVKVKVDGTDEVFTRVPRTMYEIVADDHIVPATNKAQRRQSRADW